MQIPRTIKSMRHRLRGFISLSMMRCRPTIHLADDPCRATLLMFDLPINQGQRSARAGSPGPRSSGDTQFGANSRCR